MKSSNEKAALKMYDVFNHRDWKAVVDLADAKCTIRNMATGEEYKGADGMKKWLQSWAQLCSDLKADVDAIASSDTTVVIEGNAHGKNDGPIMMGSTQLPASGKKLHLQWIDLVDVKDGKITGIRCYYDTGRMLSQLGIATQPQAAKAAPGAAH